MATKEVEFTAHLSLSRVQQILTDLTIYGKLHPLIYRVERRNQHSFRIFEKPFHPLPFPISYVAKVEHSTDRISYKISGIPLTKLLFKYLLKSQSSDRTIIRLTLSVESVPFVEEILLGKILRAQEEMWG